jgi:protoporphyrinogen oxidase
MRPTVVIGAGPAGLTAALEFLRHGLPPTVLEKSGEVGGIACTLSHKGFRFDMGGHRFFTKIPEIQDLWNKLLPEDFALRRRLSRIYYRGRFFSYPLKAADAFLGLGPLESLRVVMSYVRWQLFPSREEHTFEEWVTNRFGARLYRSFFESYTEKVWGMPPSELKADWAAQRIKGLTLKEALLGMFRRSDSTVRSLIEEFNYPLLGPGMLWGAARDAVVSQGGSVHHGMEVFHILHNDTRMETVVAGDGEAKQEFPVENLVSSMPIDDFISRLVPAPPQTVVAAAKSLRYRAFITVCLIVDKAQLFPDQWIYVQDSSVRAGRIQNFKNWSPAMVPDPDRSGIGLEYFSDPGDDLWELSDWKLIELAVAELSRLGFARPDEVSDGMVFRIPKAYPVYVGNYADSVGVIRDYVSRFENFQTVGRNGLFRYNNMDHSMLTALYAVRNLVGNGSCDVWNVNEDTQYLES